MTRPDEPSDDPYPSEVAEEVAAAPDVRLPPEGVPADDIGPSPGTTPGAAPPAEAPETRDTPNS